MKSISKSASALGKKGGKIGGKSTSEKKRLAVRENGKLGGRPVGPLIMLRDVSVRVPLATAQRMDIRDGDMLIIRGSRIVGVDLSARKIDSTSSALMSSIASIMESREVYRK